LLRNGAKNAKKYSTSEKDKILKAARLKKLVSNAQNAAQYDSVSLLFFLFGLAHAPLYASAEACLTGWPNAQPQLRD